MKERVLSYQLAQTLTAEELQEVSGAMGHTTSGTTGKVSGSTPGSWDAGVDGTWDF